MEKHYQKLNEDQINAVEFMNNALVIAGAGSGKTTTIIAKLDYLIKNKLYLEKEILIISFTNESVNDLKKRTNYNVDIKTFHKLAVDIINDKNLSICQEDYLCYIIDEYMNSYAIENEKTKKAISRVLRSANIRNLTNLVSTFINLYKANYENIDYLFTLYRKSFFQNRDYLKIILEIYQIYLRELESAGLLDFNDLINHATKLISDNIRYTNYKFIIIDEFQDTSLVRFKLIEAILKQNNGKIFVVGDDYQSIYRFSGCNLDIFLNIQKHFPDLTILHLNHNYRNNQALINVANNFIIRNKKQIKKNTICHKDSLRPIKMIFYVDKKDVINKLTAKIDGKILILGRNNRDKDLFCVEENDNIRFLTIHRSKGLEEDNVIIVNFETSSLGFPSKIINPGLINKIITKDYILYEEERRLMYVALTRTRNNVYLLVPKNNYSVFIKELLFYHKNNIEIINID